MKTYFDKINNIEIDGIRIPKDNSNTLYRQFLNEQALGQAVLEPLVLDWKEIRIQRDNLLKESDWTDLPNTPLPNKQDWLDYRQALRDIPQDFANPEDVVWPTKP